MEEVKERVMAVGKIMEGKSSGSLIYIRLYVKRGGGGLTHS